jgi:ABC-type antimicrobial peptide transport system permease subunit
VRHVATVADSIPQANLVIAEDRFEERFPSQSGYRAFLVAAPAERADEVSRELVRALTDHGLELEPTGARLEAFHSVQNAYLLIFQTLGGLGLLLGTAGLGMVVLRNTLERRGELAVARAVGYPKRAVRLLVGGEHAALVLAGLVCGSLAALVAIVPALLASVGDASFGLAGALVAASLACALGWVALATAWALRGALIDALRNE